MIINWWISSDQHRLGAKMNEAVAGAAACQGSALAAQRHCVATSICHCVQHQSITGTDNLREQQTQKLQLRKRVAHFAAIVFSPAKPVCTTRRSFRIYRGEGGRDEAAASKHNGPGWKCLLSSTEMTNIQISVTWCLLVITFKKGLSAPLSVCPLADFFTPHHLSLSRCSLPHSQ